jgi:hypothetical protein
MFYLFDNMLRAYLHVLRKSKFLHACIQLYGFFHMFVRISWSILCNFLYLEDVEIFVHNFS